jgi:hypothetical protein
MVEIKYYKKYTGKSSSIVDALKAIGVKDASLSARKKIATLNGIKSYSGTSAQNTTLLAKLKSGKLIKSKTEVFKVREKFLGCLQKYQPILKKYGKQIFYSFDDAESSFAKAYAILKKGKKTGSTCVVPCRWALRDIGISPSGFTAEDGSFAKCYNGEIAKHLKWITSGEVIGLTVKEAVDRGLLKPGDIITYKDKTHTFVYSGDRYYVYDGGRYGDYAKDGILHDYKSRDEKISEILRWAD